MDPTHALVLAVAAAWASGLSVYATVLVLGLLEALGLVALPPGLEPLGGGGLLAVAALLYVVEFFADKIPGVDSLWDLLHTVIRIPGGALLAAGAVKGTDLGLGGEVEPLIALLAGGTLAALSHATKAGGRALINTSPEPFSNIAVSLTEDALVVGALLAALLKPVVFVIGFALLLLIAVWLIPKIFAGIKWLLGAAQNPLESVRAARAGRAAAGGRPRSLRLGTGGGRLPASSGLPPSLPPK